MNMNEENQTIEQVVDEIEALLRKHDVAGCVVLASKTGELEYLLVFDVSWTAIVREDETKMRLVDGFPSPEVRRKKFGDTVGMISGVGSTLIATCALIDNILGSIAKAMNIPLKKKAKEPSKEDL
jgi:hypothetical protein